MILKVTIGRSHSPLSFHPNAYMRRYSFIELKRKHKGDGNLLSQMLAVGILSKDQTIIELPDNFFDASYNDMIVYRMQPQAIIVGNKEWPILLRPFKLLSKKVI